MTKQQTSLATRQAESLEHFGDRAQIREMFDRIKTMIPGAANAPDAVVLAAAQKAVAHGIDLFDDEMYLMEVKGRWTAHVGIRGLRRNADGKYMFEESDEYPRRLTDDEIAADIGKEAKPGIIGIEIRMYNLVKARECKELGIPYFARKERGYWFPGDNVPATRTPPWVAQKRAEKMALRAEFSLTWSGEASKAETMESIEWHLRQEDRRTALPSTPRKYSDDEDDMYLDRDPNERTAQAEPDMDDAIDAEYTQTNGTPDVDFGGTGENPSDDAGLDDALEGDPVPVHIEARDKLTGNCAKLAEWARQKHMESNGPATDAQYQYLAGTIDKHVGEEGAHRLVLSVLCRAEISNKFHPGAVLATKLLDFILEEIKNPENKDEKIANPNFKQDYVNCLSSIYRVAQGQAELLPETETA